jgi:hypothetical protein
MSHRSRRVTCRNNEWCDCWIVNRLSNNTSYDSGARSDSGGNNFGGIDGPGKAEGLGRGLVGLLVSDGDGERKGLGNAVGLTLGAEEDEGCSDSEGYGDEDGYYNGRSEGNNDADGRLEPGVGIIVGSGVLLLGDLEPPCVGTPLESDKVG